MCSPQARSTGRPERWISSASWTPVAEAPTTSTPALGNWSGLRYSGGVSARIEAGTASASFGTAGRLQAPLATTTVRALQSPRSVATR